jgi:hypothetical protein
MTQSTRLYRVMSLLTIPVVAIAIVLMADLVLHPLEPKKRASLVEPSFSSLLG